MIRILIADDHAIVRRGLRQILAEEQDLRVEGEVQDAQELLARLRDSAWDVLVLDLNMPGRSGLEVLEDVKLRWPKLPVLVLSMHPEDQYAIRVLKAGAAGYMTKESAPDELVAAIRKVHAGGKYVSPAAAELLAHGLEGGGKPRHESLSNREYQVLCELAAGRTVSDVAVRLKLSVKTISTYRTRLLEKLGLSNNAELMHYAISRQLVGSG
jgi:two-component system invasion response regulator UvrY